jgi:cysteine-rich repeat protein
MTTLFSHARTAAACAALGLAFAPSAFAVGGNDVDTSTKISVTTQVCQTTIASGGAKYAIKAAAALNACLDAIVKCDEQADAAKALTCRRALLVRDSGKCAVGKVDEGASMLGNGAALHANLFSLSKAVLLKEMRTYTTAIQKKCFDVTPVDLVSVSTGLGFSPTPGTKLDLADATNQDPGGIQCLANGLVLKTHPLANDITLLVENLHGTCVVSKDLAKPGTACAVNAQCDGTGTVGAGRCGALAMVFRQGSIKPCATPPTVAVCGDGSATDPEQCEDGNVVNGDGCSSICTLEPVFHAPRTGQTTCWNSLGAVISCAGTKQDGELLKGAALAYVDNGDGTITDINTGLMWEKLSDDGTINDWDNQYSWDNAFAVKLVALNGGGGFALHTDWRLPNKKELESIVNAEVFTPAVSSVFDTGCVLGATVLTGSCTQPTKYWSSSSFALGPASAWSVDFDAGDATGNAKAGLAHVRAVRAGP